MSNINYEIYSSSSLPINGWLQSCIHCRIFTSKIYKMNYDDNELIIYLCNKCKKSKIFLKNVFYNRVIVKYNFIKKINNNNLSINSESSDISSESDNSSNNDFFDNENDLPHYLKKKWVIDKIKKD
jgi:hypothetical protein